MLKQVFFFSFNDFTITSEKIDGSTSEKTDEDPSEKPEEDTSEKTDEVPSEKKDGDTSETKDEDTSEKKIEDTSEKTDEDTSDPGQTVAGETQGPSDSEEPNEETYVRAYCKILSCVLVIISAIFYINFMMAEFFLS